MKNNFFNIILSNFLESSNGMYIVLYFNLELIYGQTELSPIITQSIFEVYVFSLHKIIQCLKVKFMCQIWSYSP
jgi:hypothetical protein